MRANWKLSIRPELNSGVCGPTAICSPSSALIKAISSSICYAPAVEPLYKFSNGLIEPFQIFPHLLLGPVPPGDALQSLSSLSAEPIPHHLRWIACHYGERRYVREDHRARRHDSAIADLRPSQHGGTEADPYIVPNGCVPAGSVGACDSAQAKKRSHLAQSRDHCRGQTRPGAS